jgi:hypothetical protein
MSALCREHPPSVPALGYKVPKEVASAGGFNPVKMVPFASRYEVIAVWACTVGSELRVTK